MKKGLLIFAGLLTACGFFEDDVAMPFGSYIDLGDQPNQIRNDFNSHVDQVRLVFIVGPT